MTQLDLDPVVREELERTLPLPETGGDWNDALRRAQLDRPRRRRLLLLAAAIVMAGAVVAAVTAAVGGFDSWLNGTPGRPAPPTAQARFTAANARSIAAFPQTTELRELLRTRIGGKLYALYGFRSGDALCLLLKAVSLGHSTRACATAPALARLDGPILPVEPDYTFSDRYNHPSAEVSFGIAANDVTRVDVHAVDGDHRAAVGGNAYLFVENEPNTANRVLELTAVEAGGARTTVPTGALASVPKEAPGPRRVQARIPHPRVGWYERGEHRGISVREAKLTPQQLRDLGGTGSLRLVKPDPSSDTVVGLDGGCLVVVDNGVGRACGFPTGPLNVVVFGGGLGFAYTGIDGVAADGVARVVVFLADGEREAARLRDNLFSVHVPGTAFPARVVAYDGRGRVVGIRTLPGFLHGRHAPSGPLQVARRVVGPYGTVATLGVGEPRGGYRCWRVTFSTGQAPGGCNETAPTGPWVAVDVVQPAGRDIFVAGHTRAPVERVELRFAGGEKIATDPVAGVYVFAIPRDHLRRERQLVFVVGVGPSNLDVQRQGVLFAQR